MATLIDQLTGWMRQQTTGAGARGLVVGLSGGVDSAVVARLAQLAMGDQVLAVRMPAHSDPQDEADAELVAAHFGLATVDVDLSGTYDTLIAEATRALGALASAGAPVTQVANRLALANVSPRLRMTTLYFVANRLNYLVAGTGNRSEIAVGYYTKYGDGGVDLLPIAAFVKSQVQGLARDLGVPARIVDKVPSAGLWIGQTDEDEMGFSYADLEAYLHRGPDGVEPATALRIERLARGSDHKRLMPAVFLPSH